MPAALRQDAIEALAERGLSLLAELLKTRVSWGRPSAGSIRSGSACTKCQVTELHALHTSVAGLDHLHASAQPSGILCRASMLSDHIQSKFM